MAGSDATLVASKLSDGIGTAARDPGEVGLPDEVRRFGEHDVQIESVARRLLVFPVVIVPAEGETFGIHRFAQLRELLAKGAPLRFTTVAFANERCWRKNRLDPQVLADFRYCPCVGTQTIHADMTAWSHHTVVVECPFQAGRIA